MDLRGHMLPGGYQSSDGKDRVEMDEGDWGTDSELQNKWVFSMKHIVST